MYRYSNPSLDEKLSGLHGVLWQDEGPRLFQFDTVNRFICGDVIIWNPKAWLLLPNPVMPGEDGVDYRSYADWQKAGRCVSKGQKSHKKVNGVAMFSFAQTMVYATTKLRGASHVDNIGTKPAIMPEHDDTRGSQDGLGEVGSYSDCGAGADSSPAYLAESDPFREEGDGDQEGTR